MATTLTLNEAKAARNPRTVAEKNGLWHRSVPKRIANHCRPHEPGKGWKAWVEHLEKRKNPAPLSKVLPAKASPLLWALADELEDSPTRSLIERLAQRKKKHTAEVAQKLETWVAKVSEATASVALGLECLAVAHELPALASVLDAGLWWRLLEHLIGTAAEPAHIAIEADPLAAQLLDAELPFTLAYQFPELDACRHLAVPAKAYLTGSIVELTDGQGMLHNRHLHLTRPLLACWTRTLGLAKEKRVACFAAEGLQQYEWLVRNALLLSRRDGSQALSRGSSGAWHAELFDLALELGGDADDRRAAKLTLPGAKASETKNISPVQLPDPSVNSEWSGLAVLQPAWSLRGPKLTVSYGGPQVELELEVARQPLFSGVWDLCVQTEGRTCRVTEPWEEVCWESDDDVDYLELETELGQGLRLQRQILLAREDEFLYLADCVLSDGAGGIHYDGTLPLCEPVRFAPSVETREGTLGENKPLALVIPLGLPEWRIDPRFGSLFSGERGLELKQHGCGANLCAALFLDLSPRRFTKQVTWRNLTVAERLAILPPDAAVGYRVQSGKEQWLFYRSLGRCGNRSLLGQNFSSEFYAGQFDREGEVTDLIEVE